MHKQKEYKCGIQVPTSPLSINAKWMLSLPSSVNEGISLKGSDDYKLVLLKAGIDNHHVLFS